MSQTASSRRLLPTVPCPQQRSDARVPERGLGSWGELDARGVVPRPRRPTPVNLARAVPFCTGPGRDHGWDHRSDASREPDRGRANQVACFCAARLDKAVLCVVTAQHDQQSSPVCSTHAWKHSQQRCHRAQRAATAEAQPGGLLTDQLDSAPRSARAPSTARLQPSRARASSAQRRASAHKT